MHQVIRAAQHIKVSHIANRVDKTLEAFVTACAVLDADDVRVFGQFAGRRRLNGIGSPAWNAIDEDRDCIGNFCVGVDQLVLLQGNGKRSDHRNGIDAHRSNVLAQLDRF